MDGGFAASLPAWTGKEQQMQILDAIPQMDAPPQTEHHLPWELWVQILQHVDLSQRLGTCAAVSSIWHTAALAATNIIQHRSRSSAGTAVLQDWLATYGSHLHSIQLSAAYHSTGEDLQLTSWDCPRLQTVSLSHITLTHLDTPVTSQSTVSSSKSSSTSSSSSSSSMFRDTEEQLNADMTLVTSDQGNNIDQGLGFSAFRNLTSLALQYCCLSSLASLAAVTGLSHLRLEKPQPPGFSSSAAAYTLDAAPMASLQKLTSLQIVKGCYRGLVIAACHLTNLQELQLARCKDSGVAGFDSAQLWQQLLRLTSLHIDAVPGLLLLPPSRSSSSGSSSSSSMGSAQPLQRLQMLEVITAAGFDPMLLSAARGLKHMHLTSTPLIGGPAGTASLLAVLSQLTDLRYMNLKGTLQHVAAGVAYPGPGASYSAVAAAVAAAVAEGAAAAAGTGVVAAGAAAAAAAASPAAGYSALTASSRLQYLDLSRCLLPPDAIPAMFAISSSSSGGNSSSSSSSSSSSGSSRLPHLQHLLLADTFHAAANMPLLVSACPSVHKLDIVRATPYDTPLPVDTVSALAQLQHLTNLSLCNVDDAAAVQLARLTNLESLSVVWQSSISDEGVQELTALRRLTQLWVHGSISRRLAPGYLLSLQSQVLPPDVWCQLREACMTANAQHQPEAPESGYTPQQLLTLS